MMILLNPSPSLPEAQKKNTDALEGIQIEIGVVTLPVVDQAQDGIDDFLCGLELVKKVCHEEVSFHFEEPVSVGLQEGVCPANVLPQQADGSRSQTRFRVVGQDHNKL